MIRRINEYSNSRKSNWKPVKLKQYQHLKGAYMLLLLFSGRMSYIMSHMFNTSKFKCLSIMLQFLFRALLFLCGLVLSQFSMYVFVTFLFFLYLRCLYYLQIVRGGFVGKPCMRNYFSKQQWHMKINYCLILVHKINKPLLS